MRFQTPPSLLLFPHPADGSLVNYQKAERAYRDEWWAMVARSARSVCLCVCVCFLSQHPDMWVIERETRHTPPDLAAVRSTLSVSTSPSLPLCRSHTLCLSSLFIVLRHPISHSPRPPDLFQHLRRAEKRLFKGPFVPLREGATWIFSQMR